MPTPRTAIKQRLLPYRILTCLLYGQYEWLVYLPETGQYQIALGSCSRYFSVTIVRLKDQLKWLYSAGFVLELSFVPGKATLTILSPTPKRLLDAQINPA